MFQSLDGRQQKCRRFGKGGGRKDMGMGNMGDLSSLDSATLLQYLPGVRFPAEKEQIASTAEGNGAPQELVEKIRNASRNRFNGPDEVLQEIQGR
jgi:Protein of unknown function (DUF2795)